MTVDLTYDSRRKMVSSTWFSPESNLEGKKTKVRMETPAHQGDHSKGSVATLTVLTCWYEAVGSPAVAFQGRWSSLQPPSAARARHRWPAEMPGWPRFAGISPADAYKPGRKQITADVWLCESSAIKKKKKKHADTAVMDSLALFGLKQASFYEVGYRLNKRMNMSHYRE